MLQDELWSTGRFHNARMCQHVIWLVLTPVFDASHFRLLTKKIFCRRSAIHSVNALRLQSVLRVYFYIVCVDRDVFYVFLVFNLPVYNAKTSRVVFSCVLIRVNDF